MMYTKILTGVILLTLVALIGFFHNLYLIWIFFGVIYLLALYETMKLIDLKDEILIYLVGITIWIATVFIYEVLDLIFLVMILFASIMAYNKKFDYKIFFPLIYPTIPMIYLFKLYDFFGINALFWLLIVVALSDIFAFVFGKSIGKRKFSNTSPNKTIEGVIGGVSVASIFGTIFGIYVMQMGFLPALIISLFTSKSSIFGDLFESFLKRSANVKDSGNILPAHGGVLDRIDGYLFGGVVMFILLKGLSL